MANPKGTPENLRPISWAKGQSGNPKGYSKSRRQIDDLLELILDSPGTEREISRVWLANMLEGNFAYLKEYLERRDGKVASSIEISDKPQIDWSSLDNECDTPPRKTTDPKGPKPLPASGNTSTPVVARTLGGMPPGSGQGDDR
jgi:hypothetical protein